MERELLMIKIAQAPILTHSEHEGPGRRISIMHGGFQVEIAHPFFWSMPRTAPTPPHKRLEMRFFACWELVATQLTLDADTLLRLLNDDVHFAIGKPVKLEEHTLGQFTVIDGHHRLAFSLLTGSLVDAEIRSFYDAT